MIIPTEEFWLPISVSYTMGEPIVTIARLKQRPKGFLSDVDLRQKGDIFKLPLNDIDQPYRNDIGITGLIFHLPRSGSTAVARALTCLDNTTCFFEPAALDQLLSPQHTNKIDPLTSLRKLLCLFGSVSYPSKNKVFIKLSSWSTLHILKYKYALPNTPFFFVYRNPIEILVQILQRPTGWMQSPAKEEIEQQLSLENSMPIEEYSSKMLCIFCQQVLKLQHGPISIKHSELMESSINAFRQILGSELGATEFQKIENSFAMDSEDWRESSQYVSDSQQLINSAPESLVDICHQIIAPSIALLDTQKSDCC